MGTILQFHILVKSTTFYLFGRAVAQAVSHRPLRVMDRFRTQHISCGICRGGTGRGAWSR